MSTQRLFLALSIDPTQHPELMSVAKKLRTAADQRDFQIKWAPAANWHVTVLFIGEVESSRQLALVKRLEAAAERTRPFELRLTGIGAFPDERHARVLWAGVSRTQSWLDLQSAVEAEFASEGFIPDDPDSRPHLTLGRLRSAGSVRDLISPFVRRDFGKAEARRLTLFESVQRGPFPHYQAVASAALSGTDI